MKVALLGAKGFLGSFLFDYFKNSHYDIIPVTRQVLDLVNYQQVQTWLERTKPNVIVNCAVAGGGINVDIDNPQDLKDNLNIFLNFFNSQHDFRFINIGSGAEFDRNKDISLCREDDIVNRRPTSSYGYAKNVIARLCWQRHNFYTLRLFGCFHNTEPKFRLFPTFLQTINLPFKDRYYDYISADDFALIVDHYITNSEENLDKDINCVYPNKLKLSEILLQFAKYHCPQGKIEILPESTHNYTGDGTKLSNMKIALTGLETGLRNYI